MKAILEKHEWELFERLQKLHKAGALPKVHLRALLHTKALYENLKEDILANIDKDADPVSTLEAFAATLDCMIEELRESIDTFNKELSEAEFEYISSEYKKRQSQKQK